MEQNYVFKRNPNWYMIACNKNVSNMCKSTPKYSLMKCKIPKNKRLTKKRGDFLP